jgi:hypothetical protein
MSLNFNYIADFLKKRPLIVASAAKPKMTAGDGHHRSAIGNRSTDGIKFTKRRSENNLCLQDSAPTTYLAVAPKWRRAARPYSRSRINDNRSASAKQSLDLLQ